ncbi:MAG: hypothetical protein LIO81_03415 [Clostridiales bacterium]|nr:hypothetical protein [Clostridiales bacterium]
MLSNALDIILQFQVFLIAVLVVGIVLEVALALATRRFAWQGRGLMVYGFLFGLGSAQALWLAAGLLWFVFAASSALFAVEMEYVHLLMLVLLSFARMKARPGVGGLIRDLCSSVLVFAALLSENLLVSYLRDTRFQWQIVAVLVMLVLFILSYGIYFVVRDLQQLVAERSGRPSEEGGKTKKARKKKSRKQRRKAADTGVEEDGKSGDGAESENQQ